MLLLSRLWLLFLEQQALYVRHFFHHLPGLLPGFKTVAFTAVREILVPGDLVKNTLGAVYLLFIHDHYLYAGRPVFKKIIQGAK
jgi:hypothetical protein